LMTWLRSWSISPRSTVKPTLLRTPQRVGFRFQQSGYFQKSSRRSRAT
jgi:hypothetical protein